MEDGVKTLIEHALSIGADRAGPFSVKDIVLDERVTLKCRVPICKHYNHNLMCPPNVMSISEFSILLTNYSQGLLIQTSVRLEKHISDYHGDDRKDIYAPANELHRIVNAVESKAFSMGFRFAAGFIGGACKLCDECVAVHSGDRCRYPFQARPSMEAMGIDVYETARNIGLPIEIPPGDEVRWTGMVLIY